MKLRKNDTVVVIVGKDRGTKGKVRQALPKEGKVVVEGVNMAKRHMRPRGAARQAGIIEREAPIHISKLMLWCIKCDRPTRIGFRFLEDGRKVRICRRCEGVIE